MVLEPEETAGVPISSIQSDLVEGLLDVRADEDGVGADPEEDSEEAGEDGRSFLQALVEGLHRGEVSAPVEDCS